MSGTSAGARKGWETRRAKTSLGKFYGEDWVRKYGTSGPMVSNEKLRLKIKDAERRHRSKKLSEHERHMAGQDAKVLRYQLKRQSDYYYTGPLYGERTKGGRKR